MGLGDEDGREAEFGDGGEVGADVESGLAAVCALDGASEGGDVAAVAGESGCDKIVLPVHAVRC